MQKVSVVITTLNEQNSTSQLLNSLLNQTKKAEEIIFIDAGSTDKTVEIIRGFQNIHKNLKVFIQPGVNRAKGRNIGIQKAQSEIIAITDAGCIAKKNWLKNLTRPFKNKSIDVVGGFYQPEGDSVLQKSLAVFTSVLAKNFNAKTFLPSSRSLAFKKEAWKKVGGYPEEYDTCEDLVFINKLKDIKIKVKIEENAKVLWTQHDSWIKAFFQFFHYAIGDAQALYQPHLKKILLVFFRYLIGILLFIFYPSASLILISIYFVWAISKGYGFVKDTRAVIVLPLLQIVSDIAVMAGSLIGFAKRLGWVS